MSSLNQVTKSYCKAQTILITNIELLIISKMLKDLLYSLSICVFTLTF